MSKLVAKPKLDIVFKLLLQENRRLLVRLLGCVLSVPEASITDIDIRNSEILPEELGAKFIRLDVFMKVDGRVVNCEMQVSDQGNFKERAAYYLSRMFSGELPVGEDYGLLPETVLICFVDFDLFSCEEYRSDFAWMETTRHEVLTDRCLIKFFELTKIPEIAANNTELLLKFFKAESEEDLNEIVKAGDDVMTSAVGTLRDISADEQKRQWIRIRERAINDEANALNTAAKNERTKWVSIVADKDSTISEQANLLEKYRRLYGDIVFKAE